MGTITRAQFVNHQASVSLPLYSLTTARRLEGVDVVRADLNKDGLIAGAAEAGALWDAISATDVVETTKEARRLPLLPSCTTTSVEGERLAAVESFRLAELRKARVSGSGDPFGREGFLKSGPARGEPLNTDRARPVARLDAAQKAEACRRAGVDPASIEHAFANLSHGGAFYTALVPRGAVRELSVLEESFPAPVPAAHLMLRFKLADDKAAILVPQSSDASAPTLALPDIVFSSEAIGQPGATYDIFKGQKGHFGFVDRFESLEDRYRHVENFSPRHPVAVHTLNLSPEQANAVLAEAVTTSERLGLKSTYNTFFNSCGTEAFAVLDRGIGHDVPLAVKLGRAITGERLPALAEKYLDLRGLRAPGATSTDLHDEMTATPRFVTPRT